VVGPFDYHSHSEPPSDSQIEETSTPSAGRLSSACGPAGQGRFAVGAALAAVFIWALVPVGTRFFVQRIDPLLFNVIRFLAAGAAALPMTGRVWRWPRRDQVLLTMCALLAVPGYNIPVALGAKRLPAGEIGLLIATEPVFIVAFSVLLRRCPLKVRIIAGSALALAGVVWTGTAQGGALRFPWQATLEVLGGAASWSCYTVLAGELNERHGTFAVTGAILVLGTAALLALSLPLIPAAAWPAPKITLALGAMGLTSSMLGFLLWNHACASLPAERVGLLLYLIPIVSVIAGARLLDEPITMQVIAGGAATILGVWIAVRPARAG
jgi:drug/metabolite transporter (DMT)-like permease